MTPEARGERDARLRAALGRAQAVGIIGPVEIEELIEHARLFVAGLEAVSGRVIDLGAGGGVPGLVIAIDRPDLDVVLIDRRAKRTDLLRRSVAALGIGDRVRVLTDDVVRAPRGFDAVVARSFGSPSVTAEAAARVVRPGGVVLVSEPPERGGVDRWAGTALEAWKREAVVGAAGRVARFRAP